MESLGTLDTLAIEPALISALLWLLFAATHVGLATRRIRAALVARLGERGFLALFSAVAAVTFAAAVAHVAAHRSDGAPGPALGAIEALRPLLVAMSVLGIVLVSAGSVGYTGSAYDLFAHTVRPPRGIERITRHPFFVGLAIFAMAHVLFSTHLVGSVMFTSLALLAILGAVHQDAKLAARVGRPYAAYVAATSLVPFVAIARGRQRMVWRELPIGAIAAGVAIAVALRAVHDAIFAAGGAWVIAAVVGGALAFTLQSWRRAQRAGASPLDVGGRHDDRAAPRPGGERTGGAHEHLDSALRRV